MSHYVVLTEMLLDRNYTLPHEIVWDPFLICTKPCSNTVVILHISSNKLGVTQAKYIESVLSDTSSNHAIVIYTGSVTSFAKTQLENVDYRVELFSILELSYNVTKHVLVPKHILLTTEQKSQVLKNIRSGEKHFPLINVLDPISRYFGAHIGDMFFIQRKGKNSFSVPYYRIVSS